MSELFEKLLKWKKEGNRSVSMPLEYLFKLPKVPKIYCYDFDRFQGTSVQTMEDFEKLNNFESRRIAELKAELAKLEGKND